MGMYENTLVNTAKNKMQAWGKYAEFWKKDLMQDAVANSSKNIIMLAHTMDVLNENEGVMETLVKIKGSVMNEGIEAWFCNVIACKKMAIASLDGYKSDLLTFTEEEEILQYKHVFQTKLTRETVHERIRGPLGMWDRKETFIDNDATHILNRLHEYYRGDTDE